MVMVANDMLSAFRIFKKTAQRKLLKYCWKKGTEQFQKLKLTD